MIVVLSHGKESSPESGKIVTLRGIAEEQGHETIVPDYRGIASPEDRVKLLLDLIGPKSGPFLLVGSSMGAYVSLVAAGEIAPERSVAGMLLLAPALYLAGYAVQDFPHPGGPVEIIHAWQDDVVPWRNALRFAEGAIDASGQRPHLHLVNDDHRLAGARDRIVWHFRQLLERIG